MSSCVICLGSSGRPLAGKRCTASRCKTEYAERLKAARPEGSSEVEGRQGGSISPTNAASTASGRNADLDLVGFKLWELNAIYGRRSFDPDKLSQYELRNGMVSEDREEELAYLVGAHWKENTDDVGKSAVLWVLLEEIVSQLNDSELNALDHYEQSNPNKHWKAERKRFREAHPETDED